MNKWQSLMAVVGMGAIAAIGTAATFNQPSYAQSTTFFCGMSSDGVPTTFDRMRGLGCRFGLCF
ncbi:hypothetical protein [Kamptonema sp. UHCC 0994]|uniref:hypothetical protein n=1 Tax=Kamptonema sp. UHCC 0994 TaxID=3031329 RepID=UPI0023B8B91A|nr:hypothetical protein [Kamptonema sp. UHCC 0994]MDF0554277.1 hypothetical protein [Kamptonema sp. UHCC 0994]